MDNSPIIRFRLDREIAERAHRMAAQQGLELPDVLRMMVNRAVRTGTFSVDRDRDWPAGTGTALPAGEAYEPRYWGDALAALDAETALALLYQAIADRTARLDEGSTHEAPDLQQRGRWRDERDEATAWLAAFDPKDGAAVTQILARFSPASLQDLHPDRPSGTLP